eukprot:gnl/Carplike_NY0171/13150_a19134_123.p1 GENE.gnl/Carplike_NY0171/13150_a19134_123~~gnl/Carplike_NY0171/13150_a19134_123.p1  ORF type:complete len:223 (-),score=6.51 gnl/Carplike_NY0171/13150_a19134_123:63-704(-)
MPATLILIFLGGVVSVLPNIFSCVSYLELVPNRVLDKDIWRLAVSLFVSSSPLLFATYLFVFIITRHLEVLISTSQFIWSHIINWILATGLIFIITVYIPSTKDIYISSMPLEVLWYQYIVYSKYEAVLHPIRFSLLPFGQVLASKTTVVLPARFPALIMIIQATLYRCDLQSFICAGVGMVIGFLYIIKTPLIFPRFLPLLSKGRGREGEVN